MIVTMTNDYLTKSRKIQEAATNSYKMFDKYPHFFALKRNPKMTIEVNGLLQLGHQASTRWPKETEVARIALEALEFYVEYCSDITTLPFGVKLSAKGTKALSQIKSLLSVENPEGSDPK